MVLPRLTFGPLLIAALAISGTSAPLSGQPTTAVSPNTTDSTSANKPGVDPRFMIRVFPAVGMGAVGAFAGGLLSVGGRKSHDLDALVIGVLAGGTLGSALGAAALKGRGLCTENQRFWRGLAGATLGLAAGIALVRNERQVGWLATIPFGSVMFMTPC